MKHPKVLTVVLAIGVALIGGLVLIPVLAVGLHAASPSDCHEVAEAADDGTPPILGPPALGVAELRSWWSNTGRGQPSRLQASIGDLIAIYIGEGNAEGVRGDLAFAQAVLETGYFTNSDTTINNFAGIAHYDGTKSGSAFPNPLIGVRGQIQLLKKYALGNDAPLAHPNVAPRAGASATTWGGLAGTWASASNYWSVLESVYESMLRSAVEATAPIAQPDGLSKLNECSEHELLEDGEYSLPLDQHWYDEHPEWFSRPHHDYPAVDIPVPVGTPIYAVTSGVIAGTPASGKCGIGIVLDGDDGARYTYCHGKPGTQSVKTGERVRPGQHILSSASTGNSTGPHLHFSIEIEGKKLCPGPLLQQLGRGLVQQTSGLRHPISCIN